MAAPAMSGPRNQPRTTGARPGEPALAARLARELEGEVLFDPASRGRYSTDASIYQIEPIGVVVPRTPGDVEAAITIARDAGVPVLPRGAGTSQCGQTVGEALVIDTSRYLDRVIYLDQETRRVKVQPGVVADHLNAWLKPQGLFFPVDVSPSNRATIGGMTGNNSCGARSIRYGNMVHNVRAINAVLADGTRAQFGEVPGNLRGLGGGQRYLELVQAMRSMHANEAAEIERRFPKLLRRVGGYNIDMIAPEGHNMAHLLVGSEGTLGFFTEIELDLQPLPAHRVLGVCHFPTFYAAMDATRHIVELGPTAVELVDRTLMDLAHEIELFRPTLDRFVRGRPESLLLVEFAGEDRDELTHKLGRLVELMGDLGFADAVVEATDPALQRDIWEVRKAGLNIMMSMKGEGKPVSFIEDCAVALEDLADYTARLDEVFARHGTSGTWYAHASVGTLHVRPILNLKQESGARKMRDIAEECFALVREYKGSHSGEHGDGLVRSEFHQAMFGERIVKAFETVKDAFDPDALFNPGKIVRPPKMDDRSLFRYKPGYAPLLVETALDWSEWGGFPAAIEMCNNNGTCRKLGAGVMCPSFRATRDEQHLTRGRANTLRLAITGQLGTDALTSRALYDTMALCVSCKGCRRECPTGVDMARMKVEFLHQYHLKHRRRLRDHLVAWLPRYAPRIARFAEALNARNRRPGLAKIGEKLLGLSARRAMPEWHADAFKDGEIGGEIGAGIGTGNRSDGGATSSEVVLFVDTFNRWFEPANARAALRVLRAAGYRVLAASPPEGERPLCCGRSFLASGMVEQAREEAARTYAALRPHLERGTPIVGLEPSCTFSFRDEYASLLEPHEAAKIALDTMLFEEFIDREASAGRLDLRLRNPGAPRALVHGHCHQKAFATLGSVERALGLIPDLEVETIESSCCGMAGAFGYQAEHYDVSMKMAELSLLPAVREAAPNTLLVAGGTSCRHQVKDGTGRTPQHVARVLERSLVD
jgi:FAD/FMN-containing dehydrogenase/Fe-S oxidoreductase